MSQYQHQQPSQQEITQRAFDYLVARVHAPVFFEKLATDYGIIPASDEERQSLIEMAGILQNVRAQDEVKQASAGGSPFIAALDELKVGISKSGSYPGLSSIPTSRDRLVKEAAHRLTKEDPNLVEAALVWASYQQAVASAAAAS